MTTKSDIDKCISELVQIKADLRSAMRQTDRAIQRLAHPHQGPWCAVELPDDVRRYDGPASSVLHELSQLLIWHAQSSPPGQVTRAESAIRLGRARSDGSVRRAWSALTELAWIRPVNPFAPEGAVTYWRWSGPLVTNE